MAQVYSSAWAAPAASSGFPVGAGLKRSGLASFGPEAGPAGARPVKAFFSCFVSLGGGRRRRRPGPLPPSPPCAALNLPRRSPWIPFGGPEPPSGRGGRPASVVAFLPKRRPRGAQHQNSEPCGLRRRRRAGDGGRAGERSGRWSSQSGEEAMGGRWGRARWWRSSSS